MHFYCVVVVLSLLYNQGGERNAESLKNWGELAEEPMMPRVRQEESKNKVPVIERAEDTEKDGGMPPKLPVKTSTLTRSHTRTLKDLPSFGAVPRRRSTTVKNVPSTIDERVNLLAMPPPPSEAEMRGMEMDNIPLDDIPQYSSGTPVVSVDANFAKLFAELKV